MSKVRLLLVAILCLQFITGCASQKTGGDVSLYVTVDGDDSNPGTKNKPFATFEAARDRIRGLRSTGTVETVNYGVHIGEGTYERTTSFTLTERDSGSSGEVTYIGTGNVIISGGKQLDSSAFYPVEDENVLSKCAPEARGHLLAIDLAAQGVHDFGTMKPYGMGRPVEPTALELFFNGTPMTVSRWPNDGFVLTGSVPDSGSIPRNGDDSNRGGIFVFDNDRFDRWLDAENLWVYGYWKHDWAEEAIPVEKLNPETRQIKLALPHRYGIFEDKRFIVFNLLEEIDSPGEWYLDRSDGILYFWPPADITGARVAVTIIEEPVVTINNASKITFENLVFEYTRGGVFDITNSSDIRVDGCVIRHSGTVAVNIDGGRENVISGCTIYDMGHGGVKLSGGDRPTLEPSGHTVENTHIHHFSRIGRTYRPAVQLDGVGCRVSNCKIHDAPHEAIQFGGNDHVIERNNIYKVCEETDDCGVIYTGRDWTSRGNLIKHNYIHETSGLVAEGRSVHRAQGVYIDDQGSGITVTGNVFYRVQRAFLIGGGCDNVITNNVMIDCPESIRLDARGLGWQKEATLDPNRTLQTRLASMPISSDLWKSRFPNLETVLSDDPGTPKRNNVLRNVTIRSGELKIEDIAEKEGTVANNLSLGEGDDPGFASEAAKNFAFRDDSVVLSKITDFEPIPFDSIGLIDKANHPGDLLDKQTR